MAQFMGIDPNIAAALNISDPNAAQNSNNNYFNNAANTIGNGLTSAGQLISNGANALGSMFSNGWNSVFNYNGLNNSATPLDLNNQINALNLERSNMLANNVSTADIDARIQPLQDKLNNLNSAARLMGKGSAADLSGAELAMANKYVDQNTGLTGFVNDKFGGWGNVMAGAQALFNAWGGMQQLGMAKDQLNLARDSFNFNKALTSKNLANQIKSYNTSLTDRYRARAFAETGNADAYNKQIEERKLDGKL